jgi:sigma-B regulation protein RsbU (phosphoserine phosphatase)
MVEALNWNPGDPPAELLFNVRRAVDGFVQDAEQYDDLTMLCIEYKGTVQTDELTVEASAQNLHMVQAFIDGRLDAAGCPLDTKMQVDTAAEEIFGNIAYYAYAPDKGDVSVRALVSDDPVVRLFAVLDRRIGKGTLESLARELYSQPEWLRPFFLLRMRAEGTCC